MTHKKISLKDNSSAGMRIVILLCILLVGGIILHIQKTRLQPQTTSGKNPDAQKHTFENLTVTIPVSYELAQTLTQNLKLMLRPELIPKELKFVAMEKNDQTKGNGYFAQYTLGGKNISLLYTLSSNNTKPAYLRAWAMPPSEKFSGETAASYIDQLYTSSWTNNAEAITCNQTTEEGQDLTICGKLSPMPDGSKHGVAARDPVKVLPPPGQIQLERAPTYTIVSACWIPPEGVPHYSQSVCI